jgi:hypothetical protein
VSEWETERVSCREDVDLSFYFLECLFISTISLRLARVFYIPRRYSEFINDLRDGMPLFFTGEHPSVKKAQRVNPDTSIRTKIRSKLGKLRMQHHHLCPGLVPKLTEL